MFLTIEPAPHCALHTQISRQGYTSSFFFGMKQMPQGKQVFGKVLLNHWISQWIHSEGMQLIVL